MNNIFRSPDRRNFILLGVIVFIAFFIRFYDISHIPVSLYWDEVASGYNAYSISKTFHDEYGNFLPILFRSFDDYKMPVNIYLTAISISIFGLNEFAVRAPSAFFGSMTVLIVYFLVSELLAKENKIKKEKEAIALLSAFLLAISPWHIQFSRAGFEANIALFFFLSGFLLFLKALANNRLFLLILSSVAFVIAAYGYRSMSLFLFLFIPVIIFLYGKKSQAKNLLISVFIFFLFMIPLTMQLLGSGSSRFNQTSIKNEVNRLMLEGDKLDRKLLYGKVFVENYSSYFNPQFLFITGDANRRHSPQNTGVMYIWEIFFIVVGILTLFMKFSRQTIIAIFSWLFLAIIPGALSMPSPHALRALNVLPIPQILVAIGTVFVFSFLPRKLRIAYVFVYSVVVIVSFFYYVQNYLVSNTKLDVSAWGDGYKQLVLAVSQKSNMYDRVLITGHYWQPYIYFLFYTGYDPAQYQTHGSWRGFGKFIFGGTSWDKDKYAEELHSVDLPEFARNKNVFVVLSPEEFDRQKNFINTKGVIRNHKQEAIFVLGEVK